MTFGKMPNSNLLKAPITYKAFIEKLLPHRDPMILVDGLHYYNGCKAISELTIINTNIFVDKNEFSETGLIEHMAQTAALLIGYKFHMENLPIKEGFIAAIKNLKINRLPIIKETISSEANITFEMENMTRLTIVTKLKYESIAWAEMTLVLKENE